MELAAQQSKTCLPLWVRDTGQHEPLGDLVVIQEACDTTGMRLIAHVSKLQNVTADSKHWLASAATGRQLTLVLLVNLARGDYACTSSKNGQFP